jgi:hypothetical protein
MRERRFGQDYAKTLTICEINSAQPAAEPDALGLGNIDIRQVVFARSS